jgi:hypothetical protein
MRRECQLTRSHVCSLTLTPATDATVTPRVALTPPAARSDRRRDRRQLAVVVGVLHCSGLGVVLTSWSNNDQQAGDDVGPHPCRAGSRPRHRSSGASRFQLFGISTRSCLCTHPMRMPNIADRPTAELTGEGPKRAWTIQRINAMIVATARAAHKANATRVGI